MVHDVLIAETEAEGALAQQLLDAVLGPRRVPVVGEARRESVDDAGACVELAEQHRPAVRGHAARVESTHDFAGTEGLEVKLLGGTVWLHRIGASGVVTSCFNRDFNPMHPFW